VEEITVSTLLKRMGQLTADGGTQRRDEHGVGTGVSGVGEFWRATKK
jgi:hypothetical protein